MYETKSQLDNPLQLRHNRSKEIEDFFIVEMNERKKLINVLNRYIIVLDYADNSLLVLSSTTSGVSLFSVTLIISTPVGIASASISLVLLATNGFSKCFRNNGDEKNKEIKIDLLAKNILNSIQNIKSTQMTGSDISHKKITKNS